MKRMAGLVALFLGACGGVTTELPDAGDDDAPIDASPDAATCAPEPAGLRARWRGENDVADETGEYAGTAHGALGYAAGRHGAAFAFDGINDTVSADPDDELWPAGSFSIEAWVRTTAAQNAWNSVFQKYGCGGSDACDPSFWGLYVTQEGRAYFEIRVAGGSGLNITAALTPIDDGEWHHLVGVRDLDAGVLLLYVDGALEVSTALRPEDSNAMSNLDGVPDVVTIGAARESGVDTFRDLFLGSIDEPAYYISAWTADEVAAVHAAPDGICR